MNFAEKVHLFKYILSLNGAKKVLFDVFWHCLTKYLVRGIIMSKKIIALILCFALAICFSACSSTSNSQAEAESSTSTAAPSSEPENQAEESETENNDFFSNSKLERVDASSYVLKIWSFYPLEDGICLINGVNYDKKFFGGFLHNDGTIEVVPDYLELYPISEKRFLGIVSAPNGLLKTRIDHSLKLQRASGVIIDRQGNVIYDNPDYEYVSTLNNRLLVFTAESGISGTTLKLGVMDGDAKWIHELADINTYYEDFNLDNAVVFNDDGSWQFTNNLSLRRGKLTYIIQEGKEYVVPGTLHTEIESTRFNYNTITDEFSTGGDSTVVAFLENNWRIERQNDRDKLFVYNANNELVNETEAATHLVRNLFLPVSYGIDMSMNKLSIIDGITNNTFSVSEDIVSYLSSIEESPDGLFCLLKGNDGREYYAELDSNGSVTKDPTLIQSKARDITEKDNSLSHVYSFVLFDDCFVLRCGKFEDKTLCVVNRDDGSIRATISLNDTDCYPDFKLIKLTDELFICTDSSDESEHYSIIKQDGTVIVRDK